MKTRSGFISNSSSTSFIIAIKKQGLNKLTKPCKCCGVTYIPLLKFMGECCKDYGNSEASELEATGRDDILAKWKEYTGWSQHSEEEEAKKAADLEKKLAEYGDKKWDLAWVQISYHDDILKTLFDDGTKNGSIEIIKDMG